jgi:phosphonate transport system substrate-binding protein
VLAQEVEFVFSNHLFSPDREKLGWRVFGRRMGPALYAQIAVPVESPIRKLEELNGTDVVYAGPEAFIGYRVVHGHLLSLGVQVNPLFAGNQNAAFSQLFAGRAKAVGSNSALIDGYEERAGKKMFRVLWTSEPYLDLALMASSKVSDKVQKAVASAFLGMHRDPVGLKILKNASEVVGLSEDQYFVAAKDADYAAYRRFYLNAPVAVR